jgi:hypothetical protein
MLVQRCIDADKDKELWSLGDFNADDFKDILT